MFPFSYWWLLVGTVALTLVGLKRERVEYGGGEGQWYTRLRSPWLWTALCAGLLAYFSSRTIANDVWAYWVYYLLEGNQGSLSEVFSTGLGDNPLFHFIQGVGRHTFDLKCEEFQLALALVIQPLFVVFFRRYSPVLSLSVLMFIASGLFYFTCVSWKQSLAMAIGLTLVPFAARREWVKYYVGLGITALIHPYIIMYGILPFLVSGKVWTKKNVLIISAMIVAGWALSSILDVALDVTEEVFGDRHDAQYFDEEHGVSIQRVIFFAITPVLSVLFRNRLDREPYPLMNGFIQMSVVSFGFYAMSINGGANFISRMGTYFEPFTYVALPYILTQIVPRKLRAVYIGVVVAVFLVFFSFLQVKWGLMEFDTFEAYETVEIGSGSDAESE